MFFANFFALMPIRSALLKPAACLLLGAAAVFGSNAAQAITMPWAMSLQVSGATQTGFGTLEATLLSGTTYQINSISGTWNGATITGLVTSYTEIITLNTISGIVNQFDTQGVQNFKPVSTGYAFNTNGSNVVIHMVADPNWNVYQCQGFSGGPTCLAPSVGGFTSVATINYASVPAPLPILGLPAVLFYSRKLKKRIQQRKALAVVA